MIYMFVYSELHSSESFSNPLPTIILQQIWNWSLREWILCCCQDESGGPHSATGFQEELTFARNMSKSNSLIIPCVLHFFVKKEKIQANKLLYIYTSYSATISRIWLILYKLYYCTCRNNLFCFKLILATLEHSSICCREKKLFAHSYCEFSSPRYVFKNYISQKQRNHIISKTHSSADSTLSIKSTTWKDLRTDILRIFLRLPEINLCRKQSDQRILSFALPLTQF